MKVALAQMDVLAGSPRVNLNKMMELIRRYDAEGYDIIAFPELCVGGYLVGDLWHSPDWISLIQRADCELADFFVRERIKIAAVYGNAVSSGPSGPSGQDGRPRLINAAILLYQKEGVIQRHQSAKALLPNYRFFDDKRYFSPGEGGAVFEIKTAYSHETIKVGLEICEDLWHADYPVNPTRLLVEAGAEYIFNLSASPYTYNKGRARDRVLAKTLAEVSSLGHLHRFFYVNCVGVQNNGKNILTFDGDSVIYDAEYYPQTGKIGEILETDLHPFEEHVLTHDTLAPAQIKAGLQFDKNFYQYHASLAGLRSLDRVMGRSDYPFVIGVSGGIDSALVLCLLERAVGKDRIVAVNMPSRYNSTATISVAQKLTAALGIPLHTVPIEAQVAQVQQDLLAAGFVPSSFHLENIQAKTRGTSILSNIAAITGGVMTNNGNKVEVALGYATLYGDVNGAIAPIADLLKVEVWDLSRYLNETIYGREVIPREIIAGEQFEASILPSAELKDAQIDPMKWGYHDALLSYLVSYRRGSLLALVDLYKNNRQHFIQTLVNALDGRVSVTVMESLVIKYQLDQKAVFAADLRWFVSLMERGVFKRIQAPPIIVQSKTAYGFDLRESQISADRTLLDEALEGL